MTRARLYLTTSELPDLLAAAIAGIAARHGVGTRATRIDDTSL